MRRRENNIQFKLIFLDERKLIARQETVQELYEMADVSQDIRSGKSETVALE